MALVCCDGCKRNVLPKSDGTCPSCGASTTGASSVRVDPLDENEAAAWRRHDEEKRERVAAAARMRQRGQAITAGGFALAAMGLGMSIVGYASAAAGGTYLVWSGAIVGGVVMVARGRRLVAPFQVGKLIDG